MMTQLCSSSSRGHWEQPVLEEDRVLLALLHSSSKVRSAVGVSILVDLGTS